MLALIVVLHHSLSTSTFTIIAMLFEWPSLKLALPVDEDNAKWVSLGSEGPNSILIANLARSRIKNGQFGQTLTLRFRDICSKGGEDSFLIEQSQSPESEKNLKIDLIVQCGAALLAAS